jgi:solute carrier family 25 citrate transporter 1
MLNGNSVAGGGAGMMEALVCHPLGMLGLSLKAGIERQQRLVDTIKVRMQLSKRARAPGVSLSIERKPPSLSCLLSFDQVKRRGFLKTGAEIVKRETPLGLYKGLGAVVTGIVPKMAIRFTSFEFYKKLLANKETGNVAGQATFVGKVEDPDIAFQRHHFLWGK